MTTKLVTVGDVMDDNYLIIPGMSSVKEVILELKQRGPRPVIVDKLHVNDEYGLLLMRDIVSEVLAKDKAPDRVNVYEVMTKPVVRIHPAMDIRNCAKLFSQYGITHAPVIENNELVGLVSLPKLGLDGLLKHFDEEC
jgi:Mg/Co/Ni transporter MgtE